MARTKPTPEQVEASMKRIRAAREAAKAERYAADDGQTWGIRADRMSYSGLGGASAWAKDADGKPWTGTKGEAARQADEWNAKAGAYSSVGYTPCPMDEVTR